MCASYYINLTPGISVDQVSFHYGFHSKRMIFCWTIIIFHWKMMTFILPQQMILMDFDGLWWTLMDFKWILHGFWWILHGFWWILQVNFLMHPWWWSIPAWLVILYKMKILQLETKILQWCFNIKWRFFYWRCWFIHGNYQALAGKHAPSSMTSSMTGDTVYLLRGIFV